MINKIMPLSFRLGEFVSELQIDGIRHPDLKIENLGYNEQMDITVLDFADSSFVEYPDEMDIMMKCLMPLLRRFDFEKMSRFRLGYICRGGMVADVIFSNLSTKKNINSSMFIKYENLFIDRQYTNIENLEQAKEWKDTHVNEIFSKFYSLSDFEKLKIRNNIRLDNKYYLDMYFMVVYYYIMEEKIDYFNMCNILLNLAFNEYKNCNNIVSYGLVMKCLSLMPLINSQEGTKIVSQLEYYINKLYLSLKDNINVTGYKSVIDNIVNYAADISQILWQLSDIEHSKIIT